jgi:hypothetical protein
LFKICYLLKKVEYPLFYFFVLCIYNIVFVRIDDMIKIKIMRSVGGERVLGVGYEQPSIHNKLAHLCWSFTYSFKLIHEEENISSFQVLVASLACILSMQY